MCSGRWSDAHCITAYQQRQLVQKGIGRTHWSHHKHSWASLAQEVLTALSTHPLETDHSLPRQKKTEATEADTRSSAAFQCLKGVYRKDEEQHFIREWSNKTRGNSFKIKQDRFRLDIQKKIFTQRMVRNCNRLAREVVGALSLEVFKARLEAALGNLI